MHIKNLKIYNYRNLRNTSLEFPNNGIISIIGRNGHGKTNLIESIYFLSSGRSFRTSSVNELSCWNENNRSCSVFGSVNEELSIGVTVEEKRRRYFLNDTETSISDVVGKFLTVVFSPTDIEIIRGAPSERRSFIWKHLVDVYPHILKSLVRYERAVKEKAAFLKAGNVTFKDVEPWNKILAEEGYKLIEARKNFTALLSVQSD